MKQNVFSCVFKTITALLAVLGTYASPTHGQIGYGFRPTWPPGDVISSSSPQPGRNLVTVRLPELTDEQRTAYQLWIIEYKQLDNIAGVWPHMYLAPTAFRSTSLPFLLADGWYEMRVRAAAFGRDSATSPILTFPLPFGRPIQRPTQAVIIQVSVTPTSSRKRIGDAAAFQCSVEGNNRNPYWRRKGTGQRVGEGDVLQLRNLRESDSDEYCCVVDVSSIRMEQDCATLAVGESCTHHGRSIRKGQSIYLNVTEIVQEAHTIPAADIIFLVDESASMIKEHAWLADISMALDAALKELGIGAGRLSNLFGLVGFAKDHPEHINGHAIPMPTHGKLMGTSSDFNEARWSLALNGRLEDLYLAMNLALDTYPLRPGLACQLIGVTDEGRTPLTPPSGGSPLTYDYILNKMRARGCILNVVVNEQMMSKDNTGMLTTALGVSSSGDSTVETPNGGFQLKRGTGKAMAISGHGTTHSDYVQLALALGGAAWDLNQLRKGGNTAHAFTNAFIGLKVKEIGLQVCQRCVCENPPTPTCKLGCFDPQVSVNISGPVEVQASTNISLECTAAGASRPKVQFRPHEGSSFPSGYAIEQTEDGDVILLEAPSVEANFCVDCVATSVGHESLVTHCVKVLTSRPEVMIFGATRPVVYGGPYTLTCVALEGKPDPALEWQRLPAGAVTSRQKGRLLMTVPQAMAPVHKEERCLIRRRCGCYFCTRGRSRNTMENSNSETEDMFSDANSSDSSW